jgi:hypothetical protein
LSVSAPAAPAFEPVPQAALEPSAAPQAAAEAEESSPQNLVRGLARIESAIGASQQRGGARAEAALNALYGEKTLRSDAAPAMGAEDSVAAGLAPLLKAQPEARIVRTSDAPGRQSRIEVGISDLLRQADAKALADLSRRIAGEALGALGAADPGGRQAAALADLLRDIADYRPDGAVSARLEMDGENHFSLVFERSDGGRRVLLAQFLPVTEDGGRSGALALILMGPAEVSAAGDVRQDHPGYWREYSGADRRLQWSAAERLERKGRGPWAYKVGFRDASITEQSWRQGGWQDEASRQVKSVITAQTRSWLGRAGDKFIQAPIVGPLLKFCDEAAETVLTGLMIGQRALVSLFRGPRLHNLEAGADLAKNPLLKLLTGDQWHLDRLSPAARDKLFAEVRAERGRAVAGQLFPLAPERARQIVDAPIAAQEAVAALREQHGIGTFGKRLIQAGAGASGWKRAALTAGGVLAGALEGAAESVCNPIMWSMLGLGSALGAVQGTAAGASALQAVPPAIWAPLLYSLGDGRAGVGVALALDEVLVALRGGLATAEAAGALAGIYALKAAQATATALWWGPWLFSATDHVGRVVQLTAQGDFDKDYFKQLSKMGTDALYYFVIP